MTPVRLLLLSTGGTIGSASTDRGLEPTGGLQAARSFLSEDVQVEELFALSSAAIGLPEIGQIHYRIQRAEAEGIDGVVIAHGTDTLADTAFVLTLLRGSSTFPVAVTGAMRTLAQPGSDAARNLADAVAVVRSGADFGVPVVVVFDGRVLSGLRAEKVSSTSFAAFSASEGALGHVIEDRVELSTRAEWQPGHISLGTEAARSVALLGVLPGDDGTVLRACADLVDGIVIAGFGGGHVPPQLMASIEKVAHDKPLVVTTGTPAGGALLGTYCGPGSEQSLADAGAITGWSLGPRKAALALSLCLGRATGLELVKTMMRNDMKG